jgi:hypothetical protein
MKTSDAKSAGEAACLELQCATHRLRSSSIGYRNDGMFFRTQCGPFSDDDLAGLEHATRVGIGVRLIFRDSWVLLANVEFERIVDGWVAITGRVIDAPRATYTTRNG